MVPLKGKPCLVIKIEATDDVWILQRLQNLMPETFKILADNEVKIIANEVFNLPNMEVAS